MRRAVISISTGALALAGFGLSAMAFNADELEASCEAFVSEYGGTVDCSCLADAASENEAVLEELLDIESPEDFADISAETYKAIEDCGGFEG